MGVGNVLVDLIIASNINSIEKPKVGIPRTAQVHTHAHTHTHARTRARAHARTRAHAHKRTHAQNTIVNH